MHVCYSTEAVTETLIISKQEECIDLRNACLENQETAYGWGSTKTRSQS